MICLQKGRSEVPQVGLLLNPLLLATGYVSLNFKATNLDTKKTGVDEWLVYSYEPKSATISLNFLMYKVIVSTGLAGSLLCLLLALVPLLQL